MTPFTFLAKKFSNDLWDIHSDSIFFWKMPTIYFDFPNELFSHSNNFVCLFWILSTNVSFFTKNVKKVIILEMQLHLNSFLSFLFVFFPANLNMIRLYYKKMTQKRVTKVWICGLDILEFFSMTIPS